MMGILAGCSAGQTTHAPAAPFFAAPQGQALLDPRPQKPAPSWIGGDIAASIPINASYRVWLFGDTLLGAVKTECPPLESYCDVKMRTGATGGPVHNSIGILRGSPGNYQAMQRHWQTNSLGNPTSFFRWDKPAHYLWPLSGIAVDDHLIVLANENSATSGLAPTGGVLLLVSNPLEHPDQWRIESAPLPFLDDRTGDKISYSFTAAIVRHRDFLVIFGSRTIKGNGATVLARIPANLAGIPPKQWSWEWLQYDQHGAAQWDTELRPEHLIPIPGLPPTSEATITRLSSGIWETFQFPEFSYDIHRFRADRLEGPWTDSGAAYHVPAPWSTPLQSGCNRPRPRPYARNRYIRAQHYPPPNPKLCHIGKFLAYAPKAHPGLAPNGRQTLTYNVNLFFGNLRELVQAADSVHSFYVPKVLETSRPPAAPPARNDPS